MMREALSRRAIKLLGGYFAAYVALDWVSLIEPSGLHGIAPWNPATGLSFALLLRYGLNFAPAVFVAVLLADLLFRDVASAPLAMSASAFAIALGYGLAAALLRGRFNISPRLESHRDLLLLFGVALVPTAVVAPMVVSLFTAAGLLSRADFLETTLDFWIGDLIGIAVVTPLLLLAFARDGRGIAVRPRAGLEYVLQGLCIALGLWIIFGLETVNHFEFSYVLFLPLIWIALRGGLTGAALGIAATQIGLVLALQFKGLDADAMQQFQLLMLAVAITGLFLGSTVDERRRSEEQLKEHEAEMAHAARLAATGEMAGALAHELNQPLTAVIAFARACQATLEPAELPPGARGAARDLIDQAVQQALRAGEIIRRTRELLRHGDLRMADDDAARIVAAAHDLMRARAERHGIALELQIAAGLPPVFVDPIQIEQVILNLVRNSIDALIDAGIAAPAVIISAQVSADDAGFVEIGVRDNGPGFAPEIMERLFAPYTTSKESGMGLGLSISRSIVEAHGGRIRLVPGATGADIRFTVPVYDDAA